MQFRESGLPKDKLIEDAFNYSQESTQALRNEIMEGFKQQIDAYYEQNLEALDMARISENLPDDVYNREKAELEKMRDVQIKMGPGIVTSELNNIFKNTCLAPALEIQKNSDNASPALIAATLLVNCVRSPVDYKRVAAKFGDSVASVVAEVLHVDAYPADRSANLAATAADAKRAYLALLVSNLNEVTEQAQALAKRNPPQKAAFPPGQEEAVFGNVKQLWGNDKKLDKRLLDVFNSAAAATESHFKLEVDAKGALELVKGATPGKARPPKKPIKPIGDDVF